MYRKKEERGSMFGEKRATDILAPVTLARDIKAYLVWFERFRLSISSIREEF